MEESQRKLATEQGIFSLWFNWTLSTGALVLLILLSLWVSKLWLPLVALTLFGVMTVWIRHSTVKPGSGACRLIPWVVARVLLYSGIVMLVIDVLYVRGYVNNIFDPELLNINHPYITILVLGPIATIVGIAMMVRGGRAAICQDCKIRYGTPPERGYLGRIYTQESRYQLRFFVLTSLLLTAESWGYYTFYYVNVNLNDPDHFFYHWIPIIIWAITVIYMGTRYFTIWGYYYGHSGHTYKVSENYTRVRFLVLTKDSIYLGENEEFPQDPDMGLIDTPATVSLTYHKDISLDRAAKMFTDVSGIPAGEYRIRPMYKSADMTGTCNIFHFIVTLDDGSKAETSSMPGKWFSLPQLQRLMTLGALSPLLSTEINRLYTVAMMWKTYDREGRRLYRIKNYRPMFRINGIQDWDVDFNDPHWLYIARNNEDKPFFRLRKWWQKNISGINSK